MFISCHDVHYFFFLSLCNIYVYSNNAYIYMRIPYFIKQAFYFLHIIYLY